MNSKDVVITYIVPERKSIIFKRNEPCSLYGVPSCATIAADIRKFYLL
jgi:hypothetical protein